MNARQEERHEQTKDSLGRRANEKFGRLNGTNKGFGRRGKRNGTNERFGSRARRNESFGRGTNEKFSRSAGTNERFGRMNGRNEKIGRRVGAATSSIQSIPRNSNAWRHIVLWRGALCCGSI